jgi:hypothetical protein
MPGIPMEDTEQVASPRCSDYDPFHQIIHNPDRRYCADRALWEVYKASLVLQTLEERRRCREIVRAYAEAAPANFRRDLLEIIGRIDSPCFSRAR